MANIKTDIVVKGSAYGQETGTVHFRFFCRRFPVSCLGQKNGVGFLDCLTPKFFCAKILRNYFEFVSVERKLFFETVFCVLRPAFFQDARLFLK